MPDKKDVRHFDFVKTVNTIQCLVEIKEFGTDAFVLLIAPNRIRQKIEKSRVLAGMQIVEFIGPPEFYRVDAGIDASKRLVQVALQNRPSICMIVREEVRQLFYKILCQLVAGNIFQQHINYPYTMYTRLAEDDSIALSSTQRTISGSTMRRRGTRFVSLNPTLR